MPGELLNCPSCGRKLRVPPELLGKQVKCPSCGLNFQGGVEEPSSVSPPPPGPAPELSLERDEAAGRRQGPPVGPSAGPEPGEPRTGREPGPRDYEEEDEEGEEDEPPWERRRRRVRRDAEPHRGGLVLVLGILSVCFTPLACCGLFGILGVAAGLGLGIPAWLMGRADLRKMEQGVMDPEGRGQTQGGMICGIIGTALGSLGLLMMAAFMALYFGLTLWSRPVPPPPAPPPVAPVPPPPPPKNLRGHGPALRLQSYLPAVRP